MRALNLQQRLSSSLRVVRLLYFIACKCFKVSAAKGAISERKAWKSQATSLQKRWQDRALEFEKILMFEVLLLFLSVGVLLCLLALLRF